MRNLIILRGAPGSGKSTWLKEMGLEQYVLCPDLIRLMYASPIMQSDSLNYTINQKDDSKVWSLMFEILEDRMKRGELTIIDATHSRSSDFSRYNALCEMYRYRRYWVDFSDVPLETCLAQNENRNPSWKYVPEAAIRKIYARLETQEQTSGWVKIDRDKFKEFFANKAYDFNKFKKIHIIGDLHACLDPLMEFFKNTSNNPPVGVVEEIKDGQPIVNKVAYPLLNPDEFYIFVGDYTERGLQNKELLEVLCKLCEQDNTLFLPGNHEEWLRMFVFGDVNSIRNKEFLNRTMYQIKDIPLNKLKNFVRKMGQLAYFEYDGKTYLVTHGGVPFVPENMAFVATEQFIKGVGDYTIDIDGIYEENVGTIAYLCDDQSYFDTIQIHGHRNSFNINTDEYSHSINLEGQVEFGGHLRIVTLEKGQPTVIHHIKNNNFDVKASEMVLNTPLEQSEDLIARLREHPYIRETELGNDISSFNFTRDAFYDKKWDSTTTTARGLFINTETGEVVARAYNKFFNINERDESKMTNIKGLMEKTQLPAIAYKKYNGFLGILSYYNDDLHFHSKSTDKGDFAGWFKDIFMTNFKDDIESFKEHFKTTGCSMVFEVVDPVNDPHIIKSDFPQVVLLDVVYNTLDFKKAPYEDLVRIASDWGLVVKEKVAEFEDYRSLMQYWLDHTHEENMSDIDIEGVVVEIGDTYMTKMKFNYYNFWKHMRGFVDKARNKRNINFAALNNDIANYFWAWLKEQDEETLQKDIIQLREMFNESKNI